MAEEITYHLDAFDGPLDLLLTLLQKNKVNIEDIPIALICDQYMQYLNDARRLDMDIASEFIVMASELMLLKSKLLLPRPEDEQEDPRTDFAELLRRYTEARAAAFLLSDKYKAFSGRYQKDTMEISVDKTFVEEQDIGSLCQAIRRIISYNENRPADQKVTFSPMISSPIVSVEVKIVGILHHLHTKKTASLRDLLSDAASLPDMIAIFLGVLELMKTGDIRLCDTDLPEKSVWDADAVFVPVDKSEKAERTGAPAEDELLNV